MSKKKDQTSESEVAQRAKRISVTEHFARLLKRKLYCLLSPRKQHDYCHHRKGTTRE